jgi:Phosphoserine phosphatase RsbU, N-terminal domain
VTQPALAASYAAALAAYIGDRTEHRLKAAYDLGRAAVEQGLGVLDVAAAHNDAVVRAARDAPDVAAVIEASGDFLLESLASFEVVQRGATDAWRSAFEERRRARMVRELSAVLADADIAEAADESARELAQLIAEMLREMTAAAEANVVFDLPSRRGSIDAKARETTGGTDVGADAFTVPIRSIDGTVYGELRVVAPVAVSFRRDDRATVRQVADLAAAWLDRTHRRGLRR